MPSTNIMFYASLALGAGPFLFLKAFRELRLKTLIQNTPTARIRSMPMGLVEVEGKVVPRSHVVAPFSGRECVYWEVDIATRTRRNQWTIVHRNQSGQPFFVRDDTGLALVYPKGARGELRHGVEESCVGLSMPECYSSYMDEHKLAMRLMWRLSVLRFRERMLEENQTVFVLGTAEPRPQVMTVSQDAELELAATGTDGGRSQRIRELQHESVGIIRQGENERAFFLSQQSQSELTLQLGLSAWGGMLGGPALTLFGLATWLYALSHGWSFRF